MWKGGRRSQGSSERKGHERAWSVSRNKLDLFEAGKGSQHGQWGVTEGKDERDPGRGQEWTVLGLRDRREQCGLCLFLYI